MTPPALFPSVRENLRHFICPFKYSSFVLTSKSNTRGPVLETACFKRLTNPSQEIRLSAKLAINLVDFFGGGIGPADAFDETLSEFVPEDIVEFDNEPARERGVALDLNEDDVEGSKSGMAGNRCSKSAVSDLGTCTALLDDRSTEDLILLS